MSWLNRLLGKDPARMAMDALTAGDLDRALQTAQEGDLADIVAKLKVMKHFLHSIDHRIAEPDGWNDVMQTIARAHDETVWERINEPSRSTIGKALSYKRLIEGNIDGAVAIARRFSDPKERTSALRRIVSHLVVKGASEDQPLRLITEYDNTDERDEGYRLLAWSYTIRGDYMAAEACYRKHSVGVRRNGCEMLVECFQTKCVGREIDSIVAQHPQMRFLFDALWAVRHDSVKEAISAARTLGEPMGLLDVAAATADAGNLDLAGQLFNAVRDDRSRSLGLGVLFSFYPVEVASVVDFVRNTAPPAYSFPLLSELMPVWYFSGKHDDALEVVAACPDDRSRRRVAIAFAIGLGAIRSACPDMSASCG